MKAAVLHGVGEVRVESVPDPRPGPDEVLIRIRACGVCGTDNSLYKGDYPGRLPGGDRARAGRGGPGGRLRGEGPVCPASGSPWTPTRSATPARTAARASSTCARTSSSMGVHRDGADAEYCVMPATNVYRSPGSLELRGGGLQRAAGLRRARGGPGRGAAGGHRADRRAAGPWATSSPSAPLHAGAATIVVSEPIARTPGAGRGARGHPPDRPGPPGRGEGAEGDPAHRGGRGVRGGRKPGGPGRLPAPGPQGRHDRVLRGQPPGPAHPGQPLRDQRERAARSWAPTTTPSPRPARWQLLASGAVRVRDLISHRLRSEGLPGGVPPVRRPGHHEAHGEHGVTEEGSMSGEYGKKLAGFIPAPLLPLTEQGKRGLRAPGKAAGLPGDRRAPTGCSSTAPPARGPSCPRPKRRTC